MHVEPGVHPPTFSMSGCPLPTFSSSSWMGSFNLSKQMTCSHWEPTTPLDQALGEHTSHSNPILRVCASLSPGIEMSALGHSKSWVLCRIWDGLKRFSPSLGVEQLLLRGQNHWFGNQLKAWVWGFPVERRWSKAWKVLFDSPLPWVIPVEWDSVDSPSASLRRVQTLANGQWYIQRAWLYPLVLSMVLVGGLTKRPYSQLVDEENVVHRDEVTYYNLRFGLDTPGTG